MSAPAVSFSNTDLGKSVIDAKTPISFGVGLVAGLSGINASWATVVVVGFEAFLIMLEEGRVNAAFEKRSPQSYGNQLVDVLSGIAGVYYGELLRKRQMETLYAQQVQARQPSPTPIETVNTDFPAEQLSPVTEVSGVRWYR